MNNEPGRGSRPLLISTRPSTLRPEQASRERLTAPDGEIWLFACQDGELAVEEDIFFADPPRAFAPRRSWR